MTDYIPTTEEVYRRFWRGTPLRSEDKLREYVAFDRWLAEVKAQEHKEEREYLIQYLQSEIKNANEWCEENKDYCTPEDNVKNSMVIAAYENLAETLIANPYRRGEEQ